jgi:hypothetical protein
MPTFYCPRCRGTDAYYAPRQVGVNVENWNWNASSGAVRRQPNSTQWQTVNRALCRQCGEIVQVTYSKQEQIDQFKNEMASGALRLLGIGAFLFVIYLIIVAVF